jgi:hypothetical protein
MAQDTRVSGKMTYNTGKGKRHGLMVASMRDYISLVKSMGQVYMPGMMDLDMMVSGLKTKSEGPEPIHGLMAVNIKENGLTTIWREWVFTLGKMEGAMKANIETIRNMGTEFTHGQITECIKVCGSVENSMDLGITQCLAVNLRPASGRMASELNGLTTRLFQRYSKANLTSLNTFRRGLRALKTWTTTQKEMI